MKNKYIYIYINNDITTNNYNNIGGSDVTINSSDVTINWVAIRRFFCGGDLVVSHW